MEEDPESEWEIQEYCPPLKQGESETSMVKWILNKGCGIGKKIIITGIVISSAPLVPPLVVLSAIGLAASVPLFASYACTNKLMNILLPTQPLMLEYYHDLKDEEKENKRCLLTNFDEYEDDDDVVREDEGQNWDVELELDESYEMDGLMDEKGYYSDEDERIEDIEVRFEQNDKVDEEGRYTDEIEVEIEEEKELLEDSKGLDKERNDDEIEVEKEADLEEELLFGLIVDEEDLNDSLKEERTNKEPLVEKKVNEEKVTEDEEEEIVEESTGLLEKIRNGERLDDAVGDREHTSNGVFDEQVKTPEEPITVKEIDSQKLVMNGNKNPELVGEMRHVVVIAEGNEENNFNSRQVAELDLVARKVHKDTDESEDAITRERLAHSNEDVRDKSGLDLFDKSTNENKSINLRSLKAGDEVTEYAADETVDLMPLPALKRVPLDSDKAKIASKTDVEASLKKDILDDEKIWEKIEAMRAIVGFKSPRQATCIGELKALYVFTGVEPPAASFKDDSDLDEVNAKLKFLMSIVGVR